MTIRRFFTATIRRRMFFSFAIVVILVLVLATATFYQLSLVRVLSRQITPGSLRLSALQTYALALSDFEGNLDRYFVIGGPQFEETVRQNLETMSDALATAGQDITPDMEPAYNDLSKVTRQLQQEVLALLALDPTQLSSREANESVVSVFTKVNTAKQLEQELAQITSAQLQNTALNQDTLLSNVIIQTVVLGGIVVLIVVAASIVVTQSIATPLSKLTQAAHRVEEGNFDVQVPVTTQDEVGRLTQTFNSMAGQLRNILETLEHQVAERTQGLVMVTDISEQLIGILNIEQLLDEVVNQIRNGFNYYHVHIYLFDQAKETLVVAAGTGEAGAKMKAKQHSIHVNAQSLVARAARTRTVVAIDDVRQSVDWLPNPLLPDTHSEVAVPIILGDEVVGVLDVQENKTAAFDEAIFSLLESLANQVALGIQTAQQFEQTQIALAKAEAIQQQYLLQAWDQENLRHFATAQAEVRFATGATSADVSVLSKPIEFRQLTIGSLELEDADPQRIWSEDELALVNAVVDQVAQAAENLRLFEETRARAGREATIREVTDKLRASPNLDALLETAARELGQQLGVRHTILELGIETDHQILEPEKNGGEKTESLYPPKRSEE